MLWVLGLSKGDFGVFASGFLRWFMLCSALKLVRMKQP